MQDSRRIVLLYHARMAYVYILGEGEAYFTDERNACASNEADVAFAYRKRRHIRCSFLDRWDRGCCRERNSTSAEQVATASVVATAGTALIAEGKHVARNLSAATLDNAFHPIVFPPPIPQRTFLVTFSPVCPHCRANHKNWSLITQELRQRKGWRILWVSRDPVEMTRDYCEDSSIPLQETFADPTYRTYMMLDLKMVPNTMVVDEKGVVEKLWPGELDSAGWKDVVSYLRIQAKVGLP
jgi:peroxiredoxin